jgi:hypothetical protein
MLQGNRLLNFTHRPDFFNRLKDFNKLNTRRFGDWICLRPQVKGIRYRFLVHKRHEWGRRGTRIGCWWGSQREEGHYEDQVVDGWIILG